MEKTTRCDVHYFERLWFAACSFIPIIRKLFLHSFYFSNFNDKKVVSLCLTVDLNHSCEKSTYYFIFFFR